MTIKTFAVSEILLGLKDSGGQEVPTLMNGITISPYPHISFFFMILI